MDGSHLGKKAAILNFCVANTFMKSGPLRMFVPNLMLAWLSKLFWGIFALICCTNVSCEVNPSLRRCCLSFSHSSLTLQMEVADSQIMWIG